MLQEQEEAVGKPEIMGLFAARPVAIRTLKRKKSLASCT